MRRVLERALSAALAASLFAASAPARAADANAEVLAQINFARTHPQDYARKLMLQPVSDWERGLDGGADPQALAEAIAFLERQTPLPPLRADDSLTAAALEHVEAQGPAGEIGHDSADGERFDARLRRHGVEGETSGENIAYGPAQADDVVRELIIDSGVPNRGHRRNIFYDAFETAGVACGPHRDYAAMCVMDFAGSPPPPTLEPLELHTIRVADLGPAPCATRNFLYRLLACR